jgi:hypothetical protein
LWRFYTAGIGTPMLFTSGGALLGWALLAITLLKKGALQHSFVQIAAALSSTILSHWPDLSSADSS